MNLSDGGPLPQPGTRISLAGYTGTVKFIGPVDNASGIWLGVEWDDPSRGKHDGIKDGKRYFECLVAGSGSFIRPSSSITCGQSFLSALLSKYVEVRHGSEQKETVVLGSSNGSIEVEAVGLDKIRGKLAKLERLREVSLDTDNVAFADPTGSIRNTCPNVRGLDLSNNLLPSWNILGLITVELPKLETLSLNRSRLALSQDSSEISSAFASLRELRLNQSMLSWSNLTLLLSRMPELHYLELGYNRLRFLGTAHLSQTLSLSKLEVLNLDGNELEDWLDVMTSVAPFPRLGRIILTSNNILAIPLPQKPNINRILRHIGLSSNRLERWCDIDALCAWFPDLQTLSISGNPLVDGRSNFRPLIIARIPSLLSLNATAISPKERTDSELFYLSQIVQQSSPSSEDARMQEHPRWKELCEKHGKPEDQKMERGPDNLRHRLIHINVYRGNSSPPNSTAELKCFRDRLPPPVTLRVLPTMTLRIFRLKLLKSLQIATASRLNQSHVRVWLLMDSHGVAEVDGEDTRDLDWWGIQDGSNVVAYLPQN